MNDKEKIILGWFDENIEIISKSKILINQILKVVEIIYDCFNNGQKIMVIGNGGSAADAQHLAAEFIGRYRIERQSLPAIALTTDSSILTAIGNDYNFDYVFARQCESLVNKNDIIFAISTSGNSENIIQAVKIAREKGGIIVGLTGNDGGKLKELADYLIPVPSTLTPRIQEVHRLIIHILCEMIDEKFDGKLN